MSITLAEAAKATGLNKTSILRSIRKGRLSGTRDELGTWRLDPAELHRVYPPAAERRGAGDAMPQHAIALAAAEKRAELAEQKAAHLEQTVEDLKRDRDEWRALGQQVQRLLAAPTQRPKRRWWWRAG